MNHPINSLVRSGLAGVFCAGALVGGLVLPSMAWAEEFNLRHAHVRESYLAAGNYTRVGVAFLRQADGRLEPATLQLRGLLTGAQGDRWYGMRAQLTYRFNDGSTIEANMEGRFRRNEMGDISGAQEATGELTGGTGRFQGIEGRFTLKGEGGLSPLTPGVLADVYGDLTGEYRLPARQ
ncbi:MAG: hypothetical protein EP306_04210 [Burkholderiales bacterium]|nr:MAG: hypothetical protein EP306_04210 [Burkholderiales bacterium]